MTKNTSGNIFHLEDKGNVRGRDDVIRSIISI